jgi:nucleotide-binding universal stress UspA family protein
MKFLDNNTVVIPFDFSEQSTKAIDHALEMAEESTILHVIHVIDPTPIMISMDPALPVPASYDHGRYEQSMQEMKKRFAEGEYARLTVHCAIGDPGTSIVDYAKSVRASLIVMPSHGRTGLNRLLMGSVAERVLRLANCPVLVMRGPGFS